MPTDRTVTITLTETHARIIRDACELLARVHLGQLDHVCYEVRPADMAALRDLADALGAKLIEGRSGRNPRECIAWDVYQAVRYALAWEDVPEGARRPSWSVQYDAPMNTAGLPLPVVEVGDRED